MNTVKKLILIGALLITLNVMAQDGEGDPIGTPNLPYPGFNCVHYNEEFGSLGTFFSTLGGIDGNQAFCQNKYQEMLSSGALPPRDDKGSCPECCVITYEPFN